MLSTIGCDESLRVLGIIQNADIMGIALLCAALGGCNPTATAPPVQEAAVAVPTLQPDQQRDLTQAEKAILAKGFAADPESAKFQWTRIPKALPADGNIDYCAMVNAKNS